MEATEDLRTPDEEGRTPMYRACVDGGLNRMKWLYDNGAQEDVRTPDNEGATPMYIASHKNKVEAMQWLFDHGAQDYNSTLIYILQQ